MTDPTLDRPADPAPFVLGVAEAVVLALPFVVAEGG